MRCIGCAVTFFFFMKPIFSAPVSDLEVNFVGLVLTRIFVSLLYIKNITFPNSNTTNV